MSNKRRKSKKSNKRRSSADSLLITLVAVMAAVLATLIIIYFAKTAGTHGDYTLTGDTPRTSPVSSEPGMESSGTHEPPVSGSGEKTTGTTPATTAPVTGEQPVTTDGGNVTVPTRKPESIDDIITISDSLGMDVNDLAGFTLDGLYPGTILKKTEDAGSAYQDGTVFVGDSVTLALSYWKYHPKEKVYYFESATPYTVLMNKLVKKDDGTAVTFVDEMREVAPERIVITIGTNATGNADKTFIKYYGDLIDALKKACPNTQLIINSIPPLTAYCDENPNYKVFKNFRINRMNLLLVGLAAYKDIPFMNLAEEFKNEEGQLKKAYSSDETCHVNQSGCEAWLKYFREHSVNAQTGQ